ncbi:MAG: tetratricopeptide repeat protein [bacterium]|nr:tetratricopeptide repeat protein [bacterium]
MKKILIGVLLLALTVTAFAQQKKEVLPYDALIRSAKIYLGQKDKDYDHVVELLDIAVANYPDPLEAHFYLGLIAAERAEYSVMMDHFRKFEAICSKENMDADKKRAKACQKDDMPKQIRETKEAELSRAFKDGVTQIRLADSVSSVMATAADSSAAAGDTVTVPGDSTKATRADIVKQLLNKGQGLFNECIVIDDTIPGIWTNLALIEKKLGNIDKALEYYQRSYKLNPNDALMVYDLANVYFDQKDYANSARYYGEFGALDKANAEAAFINQAMSYQALGDNASLEKTLDKILEVNPANAEIRYQRGVMYVRNASSPEMRDSAQKIDSLLTVSPKDAALIAARDQMIKSRQDYNTKALADFKQAAETNAKEPLYWYWYGNTAFFLEKQDESLEAYKKCTETDPNFSDCWCQLSLVYARKGMKPEAEDASSKCKDK